LLAQGGKHVFHTQAGFNPGAFNSRASSGTIGTMGVRTKMPSKSNILNVSPGLIL
jgi:hypothetical protein